MSVVREKHPERTAQGTFGVLEQPDTWSADTLLGEDQMMPSVMQEVFIAAGSSSPGLCEAKSLPHAQPRGSTVR